MDKINSAQINGRRKAAHVAANAAAKRNGNIGTGKTLFGEKLNHFHNGLDIFVLLAVGKYKGINGKSRPLKRFCNGIKINRRNVIVAYNGGNVGV